MESHKITEFQLPSVSIRNHCPIKDSYLSGFKSLGGTKVCVKQKSHNIYTSPTNTIVEAKFGSLLMN